MIYGFLFPGSFFCIFFRETRLAAGEDPKLINLEGFEAAMAERLREAKMLEPLSRARDDLLFGLPDDETVRQTFLPISPDTAIWTFHMDARSRL